MRNACGVLFNETRAGSACLVRDDWVLTALHVLPSPELAIQRQLTFDLFSESVPKERVLFPLLPFDSVNSYRAFPEVDLCLVKIGPNRDGKTPASFGIPEYVPSRIDLSDLRKGMQGGRPLDFTVWGHGAILSNRYGLFSFKDSQAGQGISATSALAHTGLGIRPSAQDFFIQGPHIKEGFSGGAVLDAYGKLAGIVTDYWHEKFLVRARSIQSLLPMR